MLRRGDDEIIEFDVNETDKITDGEESIQELKL